MKQIFKNFFTAAFLCSITSVVSAQADNLTDAARTTTGEVKSSSLTAGRFSYIVSGATPVLQNNGGYYYMLNGGYDPSISNPVWSVPPGWTIQSGQGTLIIRAHTGTIGGGAVQVSFTDHNGETRIEHMVVEIGNGGPLPERNAISIKSKGFFFNP